MLCYLPHGSAQARAKELLACARTHYELEALAIRDYERAVTGFRVYLPMPPRALFPSDFREAEPRRSLAFRRP